MQEREISFGIGTFLIICLFLISINVWLTAISNDLNTIVKSMQTCTKQP